MGIKAGSASWLLKHAACKRLALTKGEVGLLWLLVICQLITISKKLCGY